MDASIIARPTRIKLIRRQAIPNTLPFAARLFLRYLANAIVYNAHNLLSFLKGTMPPAAPSFDGESEDHEKHRSIAKRMSGSSGSAHSVQYYRKLRRVKPELRKNVEVSDFRIARKLRNVDSCDDENSDGVSETTPKRRRVMADQMFHDGDQNLALSGAEEDSEEIDYADFSSDDDKSSIESSHEDEDVPPGLQRKKKFYIVQNGNKIILSNHIFISCLIFQHIHQLLLEPLHSPNTKIDQVDEEAACDICRISECEYDDEMVFCDGCNLCVHMSCYGLSDLPPDEWLCMKCALCFGNNPPCILCPTTGGALKCTKGMDRWAHVVCALWIPECRWCTYIYIYVCVFGDYEKREPITNIEEIADERWQLNRYFELIVYVYVLYLKLQTASDDEYDVRGSETLRRLENNFYLYVEYEKISERLSIDPLVVSDVYEYWKLKRMDAGRKPLIRNPQDEIKIEIDQPSTFTLQLPSPIHRGISTRIRNCASDAPNSMFAKWSLQSGRIIRSLDMGRNLLTLVLRREKERQRLVETELAMIRNIWEQSLSPVPVSQRTVVGMVETLQVSLLVLCHLIAFQRRNYSSLVSEANKLYDNLAPRKCNLRNRNNVHSTGNGRKQSLINKFVTDFTYYMRLYCMGDHPISRSANADTSVTN
uniref:PHD-type domain-containing protein n=1 Tax=Heterorhabditis bacteriophora TaxID=37862 RepID=A0A1I7XPP0_HETBA